LLLTGQEASAQDLVQAALLKTWNKWNTIAAGAEDAYVRKVVVTTFLGWRRRRWNGETPLPYLPERPEITDAFADFDTRTAVAAALSRLPARQRAVVVLRYFNDLSESDTAKALSCSVGTVKSQTFKALESLRRSPLRNLFTEEPSDDLR
jgi:RNA polymerase sigma-70 factor (sigma-E family)